MLTVPWLLFTMDLELKVDDLCDASSALSKIDFSALLLSVCNFVIIKLRIVLGVTNSMVGFELAERMADVIAVSKDSTACVACVFAGQPIVSISVSAFIIVMTLGTSSTLSGGSIHEITRLIISMSRNFRVVVFVVHLLIVLWGISSMVSLL
jgi:hypothetical protein